MKLSIIIPVYNEINSLPVILKKIFNDIPKIKKKIIIVDDFSNDGTREWLMSKKKKNNINIILKKKNLRYIYGFQIALYQNSSIKKNIMLKNYIKIALRNLWKDKTFSILNLVGLSTAFAVAVLLGMYAFFELSYDGFHQNNASLYQVYSIEKTPEGIV